MCNVKLRTLCILLVIGFLSAETSHADMAAPAAGEVTIKRDTWGVPHVFAATLADGAFGLGYAQAEDRLEQMYSNYREATGRKAEIVGARAVEDDFQARLAGNEEVCKRRYHELPPEVREICEAFQAGMRAYLSEYPEKHPANELNLEPWMIPAVGRSLILHWPMGAAKRKLAQNDTWHFFSNEWAVRPERTADGAAFLLADPHVPINGAFRFYECRMHAGGHDISGFAPAGSPFIGVGHNAYLGWACTTGGPDTTDIYIEQTDDASNPKRYRYDGAWRDIMNETVTIAVKDAAPVVRMLRKTHHGPIAKMEGKKAYAIACPYFDQIAFVTQNYLAMTATNLVEFNAAMAMNQMMEQNVMYADVDGNIRYIRTGRVPIRPDGYDFSKPVAGDTSKTEWLGIHAMSDLVQVLNPRCGYMQNCNVSPDMMTRDPQLDLMKFPADIRGAAPGATHSRGRRAVELLESHPKLTVEDAMAIVLDSHADRSEQWQKSLSRAAKDIGLAHRRSGVEPETLQKSVKTLLEWNGFMDKDSIGATLYRGWRMTAADHKLHSNSSSRSLLDAFAEAVSWLQKNYGTAEVAYGEVNRIRRGEKSWPFSGGESGGGNMTLRAMASKMDGKTFYGESGQNWTQLIQFRRGAVRSWSATPFGESDDPSSPHFSDQAEKIFSAGKLKPTWFQPAELEGHIESTRVLHRL